tara:strand:- start:8020 stop:8205 length:186 start_codon:yes stop_codon:yes gene_type:complete
MILIKKWWVRLIVSLLSGGIITEALNISTDGNVNINAFVLGIGIYLILSIIYGFYLRKQKD